MVLVWIPNQFPVSVHYSLIWYVTSRYFFIFF